MDDIIHPISVTGTAPDTTFEEFCDDTNAAIAAAFSGREESISTAAIRLHGTVHTLQRPARHCDIAAHIIKTTEADDVLSGRQGFVTSLGRFVGRGEAMRIARAAGQLLAEPCSANRLHSEDVW